MDEWIDGKRREIGSTINPPIHASTNPSRVGAGPETCTLLSGLQVLRIAIYAWPAVAPKKEVCADYVGGYITPRLHFLAELLPGRFLRTS